MTDYDTFSDPRGTDGDTVPVDEASLIDPETIAQAAFATDVLDDTALDAEALTEPDEEPGRVNGERDLPAPDGGH